MKYRVQVYDRVVRTLEKDIEAVSVEEATHLAEDQEYTPANGWDEIYEDLRCDHYIENVFPVDEDEE